MPPIKKINLLAGVPEELSEEWFQVLSIGDHYKIERIVSNGHPSPAGFWYDQPWDEWVLVLRGRARLAFQDQDQELELERGDGLLIPAGLKHRVTWTDPLGPTVWLAVHLSSRPGVFESEPGRRDRTFD